MVESFTHFLICVIFFPYYTNLFIYFDKNSVKYKGNNLVDLITSCPW